MSVLEDNWVVLKPGVPVKLHLLDHRVGPHTIRDPFFDRVRTVTALIFLVDEEDGTKVDKYFSVLSSKLASDLDGYLADKSYKDYVFTFVKDAVGPVAPRISEVRPR